MLRSRGDNLTVLWYLIHLKGPERELAKHLLAEHEYLKSAGALVKISPVCPPSLGTR